MIRHSKVATMLGLAALLDSMARKAPAVKMPKNIIPSGKEKALRLAEAKRKRRLEKRRRTP